MKTDSYDNVQAEVEALTDVLRMIEDRGLDVNEAQRHLASALRGVVALAAGVYKKLERIEGLLEKLQAS